MTGDRTLAVLLALGILPAATSREAWSRQVTKADLCVTLGAISSLPRGRLSVSAPKMRAVLRLPTRSTAAVRFTYLGPSQKSAPLGSGELRRQFGLKLRAADSCNLLYVVWRFEPHSRLAVSIKHNPGEHSHAECGTNGYRNIKPQRMTKIPSIRAGATHSLHATLQGEALKVLVDGAEAWAGDVGAEVYSFDGPVGVRSDNVNVVFEMEASVTAMPESAVRPCPSAPVEEE